MGERPITNGSSVGQYQMLRTEIELLRNEFHRHQDDDREDFREVKTAVQELKDCMTEWTGAFRLAKWAIGLGLPAMIGLGVTHVARHW